MQRDREGRSILGVSFGGLTVWSLVHMKNIENLWRKKQDRDVCITSHNHIADDIKDIKGDVKEILRDLRKMNGGKA